MNGKAARQKGHSFELWIVNRLKALGYEAGSSRNESKKLDALKVDIVDNTKFYIQAKAVEKLGNLHTILDSMPTGKTPVVYHNRNRQGTIVAMKLEDFETLCL